jgi:hypothetical protein
MPGIIVGWLTEAHGQIQVKEQQNLQYLSVPWAPRHLASLKCQNGEMGLEPADCTPVTPL